MRVWSIVLYVLVVTAALILFVFRPGHLSTPSPHDQCTKAMVTDQAGNSIATLYRDGQCTYTIDGVTYRVKLGGQDD